MILSVDESRMVIAKIDAFKAQHAEYLKTVERWFAAADMIYADAVEVVTKADGANVLPFARAAK